MKALCWVIGLFFGCAGCFNPLPDIAVASPVRQYDATALLNGQEWFGAAFAQREYVIAGKPCTSNQFALGLTTDLPHDQSSGEPSGGVTGCMGDCTPTQHIGFHRVPLAVGRYKLSDVQSCIEGNTRAAGEYTLLVGGDVIIDRFYTPGVTLQLGLKSISIPGIDASWIEVTHYDANSNRVEGTFDLTLKNIDNKEVHFTKGTFTVTLTK